MSIKSLMIRGFESTTEFVTKNAPAILTGFAVVGTITTAVLAAHATVKSQNDIYDRDEEDGFLETATKKDIIKMCWPNYIPAIITGTATIGCIVGSQHINHRRQIALAAAYELADTALSEYKAKVVEQIGKNKEAKIQAAVDKDRIEKDPPKEELVLMMGDDEIIFRDHVTGQYFRSTIDRVKNAARKINDAMCNDYTDVNSLLYEAGAYDGGKTWAASGYEYRMRDDITGKIDVDDGFLTYDEEVLYGHTFIVAYMHYKARHDTYI